MVHHLRKRPVPIDHADGGRDIDTEILIAELLLADINNFNFSQTEGQTTSGPLTPSCNRDSYADNLNDLLQQLKHQRSTLVSSPANSSRGSKPTVNIDVQGLINRLAVLAEAEFDDHRAAIALSRGEMLPEPTLAQKALESATHPSVENKGPSPDVKRLLTRTGPVTRAAARAISSTSNAECVICCDRINPLASFRALCSHHFCLECATEMVEAASHDPQLLPLQCCNILLPVDPLISLLPQRRRAAFKRQLLESSIPPAQRLYCPKPTCSVFLGRSAKNERAATELTCIKCNTRVCTGCKNIAHPGDDCKQNSLAIMAKELAASNGWQTCPGCKMIVERISGCPHMACRCGTLFCYRCGTKGNCPAH